MFPRLAALIAYCYSGLVVFCVTSPELLVLLGMPQVNAIPLGCLLFFIAVVVDRIKSFFCD